MGIAVSPAPPPPGVASGQTVLYGVTGVNHGASSLYTVNTSTGLATLVGATGFNGVSALAFAPNGITLYGEANASPTSPRTLITINTSTGAGTAIGAAAISSNFADIAFRSDGVLFGVNGNGNLYTINTSTGAATLVGHPGTPFVGGGGLAFNAGGILYLANTLGGVTNNRLFTVNTSTGAATQVGTFDMSAFPAGTDRFAGMKFHPMSGVLYATAFVNIEPSTSSRLASASTFSGSIVVTNIGNPGVVLEAIAFGGAAAPPPPPGIPIPSSLLLLGTGLVAATMWILWRRRLGAAL